MEPIGLFHKFKLLPWLLYYLSIKPKLPNCYLPEGAPWDSTLKSERRKGGGQILGEKTLTCPHASNSLPPTRLHDGNIALCFRSVFKTSSSKRPTV